MTFNPQERADALSGADLTVSLLASAQYFRQVAWTEPLPDEEHNKLLQRVIRGNVERIQASPNQWVLSLAKHARERLVEVYQPLVVRVARRRLFLFQSMDLLDVIQEGNIGLLRALDCYGLGVSYGHHFGIHAVVAVKYALADALRERDVFLTLPQGKHSLCVRKAFTERKLTSFLGRQPSLPEVAEVLEVSESVLLDAIEADEQRQVVSVERLVEKSELSADGIHFLSLYERAVVSEDERQKELAAMFQRVFEVALTEPQRKVIELRYGFGEPAGVVRPFSVIADIMNTSHVGTEDERRAKRRLARLLHPVLLADGRLSCTFEDVYGDGYCTADEVGELLGLEVSTVYKYARKGVLPFELREPVHQGPQVRVFKKSDVLAFQEQRAAAPVKLSARRRDKKGLAAARRSALLPSVVA
jgi:RNA polymerase sigma factor (sigma-70 family)